MNEKKNFGKRAEDFFAGKGFYIVLFICMAVIGVSAWIFLFADDSRENTAVNGANQTVPGGILDLDGDVMTGLWEEDDSTLSSEQGDEEDAVSNTEPSADTQTVVSAGEEQDTAAPAPTEDAENTESTENTAAPVEELAFIWPVAGDIVSQFSKDELVYSKTMADWRTHNGVDISAQIGTKVMAVANGTVKEVYTDDLYGTTVVVDHGEGLCSIYSNLASVPTVAAGDYVSMGLVIGSVGDTAIAETSEVQHLHFEMQKDGTPINPADYLPEK